LKTSKYLRGIIIYKHEVGPSFKITTLKKKFTSENSNPRMSIQNQPFL